MECYCDVRDKKFKTKNKIKHLQNLTHIEFEKYVRKEHTIGNLEFFDIDEKFYDCITNHNKKKDFNLVKSDFEIAFDKEVYTHVKSEVLYNNNQFHLKRFSLNWIEYFCASGRRFSQMCEIKVTTLVNKRWMNYKYYIKQPMQMVEIILNMILSKNPYLLNVLDRSINHPIKRKHNTILFS